MRDLQMEMNFASYRNRFRDALDHGDFVLLVEHNTPTSDCDRSAANDRLASLESTLSGYKNLQCSLAITDAYGSTDALRAADYATGLSAESRDLAVVYLSGRNTSLDDAQQMINEMTGAGLRNIIPVSGDSTPGEGVRETRKRTFTESVHMLKMLSEESRFGSFSGCVMNPFQYTPHTLFPQYFKLAKKLNCGAKFIVSQSGWDMLKLQALRWYLGERGLFFPTIARLTLLTPEKVEQIVANRIPGVKISPDFRSILEKELRFSLNQFEAAQWRRLELQAAGCRLLGYSGVQIAGVDTPQKARTAADRIYGALQEFTSFDQWVEEYNSYWAKAEMAPFFDCFYLYDRVLRRPYPEVQPRMSEIGKYNVSSAEKIKYDLRKFFFSHADRQPPANRKTLKVLLAGCRTCGHCRLPQSFFICPELCPKKCANGPCGGIKADGRCEVGNFECIHSYKIRLAQWRKEIASLEDEYLPPSAEAKSKSN